MNSKDIIKIVLELYPFAYSVVSSENDRALVKFLEQLNFEIVNIPSGTEYNGWVVPNEWKTICAKIFKNEELIFDAMSNPLGVGILSPSYNGNISLAELKNHLYFSAESSEATPYHWTNLYRPGEKDWAFCVTKSFFDGLTEGDYRVELKTVEKPSMMRVLDFILKGNSTETILINAHNCHPWQANDDISGCAVGIAVMQTLQARDFRRYTYRLVIAPELIGTVHWLSGIDPTDNQFSGAIMLKSVGSSGNLKLQHSFDANSQLDKAAICVLKSRNSNFISGSFRSIYGNDETVFDSPGYEIPSISLTRFPFEGYHTDADTPSRLSNSSLVETYDVLLEIIDALERSETLTYATRGLVSLSNPRYSLYRAAPAPGIDKVDYLDIYRKWNLLMNCLPRELNGRSSSIDLALKYELPVLDVCDYLKKWLEKELATVVIKGKEK